MLALQVRVNGKRICTAGVEVGAVTAGVGACQRSPKKHLVLGRRRSLRGVSLTVSGLAELNQEEFEYPWWANLDLKPGDRVLIRVLDAKKVDGPAWRDKPNLKRIAQSERKHYLRLKRKYER